MVENESQVRESSPTNLKGASRSATGKRVLCIDTEPETVKWLKLAGHRVSDVQMGYKTGTRSFVSPAPHEVDVIVCDLKRPACFDAFDWGPGSGNDNFRCKVIPWESVSDTYRQIGNRISAQHQVIRESQLPKVIPGTFGPKDVQRAIFAAGIPFLLMLNEEWLSHTDIVPNWVDVSWDFRRTSASQLEVSDPLSSVFPEFGREITLKLVLQHAIWKGPQLYNNVIKTTMTVVRNSVGDVFGQVVRLGRGSIWLIPQTHGNHEFAELFAARCDKVKLASSALSDTSKQVFVLSDPFPNSLEGVRREIDHWATQQNQGDPGSYHEVGVTSRLTHLRELERRLLEGERRPVSRSAPSGEITRTNSTSIDIFVSHSSVDVAIAHGLVRLLRSAIPSISPDQIRCTSLSGYKLEGGVDTDAQLRREILGTRVFVGLLTRESLASTYVLFELGARWGANLHLTPIVAAGMKKVDLQAPLTRLNAHSCAEEGDLHQFVNEVASSLGLATSRPDVYIGDLNDLMHISANEAKGRCSSGGPGNVATENRLRTSAKELERPEPAPQLHLAWRSSGWCWVMHYGERVLRISGDGTFVLDNVREPVLFTGVRVEGGEYVGTFDNFELKPKEPQVRGLNVDFKGRSPQGRENISVRLVFVDLRGNEYSTPEVTFKPIAEPERFGGLRWPKD